MQTDGQTAMTKLTKIAFRKKLMDGTTESNRKFWYQNLEEKNLLENLYGD